MSEKLLNADQVAARLGTNRRTMLHRRNDDDFPKAVALTEGLNGLRWSESELNEWIAAKLAARP